MNDLDTMWAGIFIGFLLSNAVMGWLEFLKLKERVKALEDKESQ